MARTTLGQSAKLAAGRSARAGLRHVGERQYETTDGKFRIEFDGDSVGEYDEIDSFSWYVYTADQLTRNYGPPEAAHEARTLTEAREWCDHESARNFAAQLEADTG